MYRHVFKVRPLKNKSGLCVKEAFESILREKDPLYLQIDKGTEFKNTLFQGQLAEYEIKFYTSENDDIVESGYSGKIQPDSKNSHV